MALKPHIDLDKKAFIVLTDIHADTTSLMAVLDIAWEADKFAYRCFLGDAIGYGYDPVGVLDVLTDFDVSIRGNHELLAMGEAAAPFISLVDPDADDFLNPTNMPAAIREFSSRTDQPEPGNVGAMVRCCLESLALNYRKALEDLETLTGKHLQTVRIVGGGSRNRLLSQFTADACQRPVVTGPVEATALGNVMLQTIATGHLPDITTGRKAIAASFEQQHFEPGSKNVWDEAYGRFKNL